MKKRTIIFAVIGLLLVLGALAGIKALQIRAMIDQGKKMVPPPETVTTARVAGASWATELTAVGSLAAVQGVSVAAELPGKVVRIAFEPGTHVRKGELLLSQDVSSEEAQLPGALAQARLARAELERAAKMLAERIISQSAYDSAVATLDQAEAQANSIRATINKKQIRAPFSGRLGIRQANLGQILAEGDPIVTLQSLNPIFVNFTLPQQQLARLRVGLPLAITSDALPGTTVKGRLTALNPLVDSETRTVQLQGTIDNEAERLRAGMFVNVSVRLPVRQQVLAIPATSVLYAPYGDSVFVIAADPQHKGGLMLRQQFVRLGERRGDMVAVTEGVRAGEEIVSTGVFKLRNGQGVLVDNRLAPRFQEAPHPENS